MNIIKCSSCGTHVAVDKDGNCPACRRVLFAGQPTPTEADSDSRTQSIPDEPSVTDRDAAPPVHSTEHLLGEIADVLRLGQLPSHCCSCGAPADIVHYVQVDHDDFAATVPLFVCRRCKRRPPFSLQQTNVLPFIIAIALVAVVCLLLVEQVALALASIVVAVVAFILTRQPTLPTLDEHIACVQTLLSSIPAYRDLLETEAEFAVCLLDETDDLSVTHDTLHQRFVESLHCFRAVICISTEEELQRSQMAPPVSEALAEIVDQEIMRFFGPASRSCGDFVQVVCAVLPGRQNAFEVQGLSLKQTAELVSHLSVVPSWPVPYPFVFMVQRQLRGTSSVGRSPVKAPLAGWRIAAPTPNASAGEIALRFHNVSPSSDPVQPQSEDIETLRSRLPDSLGLAVLHAQLLESAEEYDESLAIHDALHARYPGDADLQRLRASCLESADRFEHAAAVCQAILIDSPEDAATIGYLAHLQMRMNRVEDALATVNRGLALEEQSQLYVVRAQIEAVMRHFAEAMSDVTLALFINANTAEAYFLRSRLHLQTERFDMAIADLEQYHRTAARTVESLYMMAIALRGNGSPDQAVRVFDQALDESPGHLLLKLHRAEFLAQSGKLELALEDCNSVVEKNPDSAAAFATRAAIHLESGRSALALKDVDCAVALGLDTSRLALLRGLAEADLGNPEQAQSDLSRAIELEPENTLAMFHRAQIHMLLEDHDSAIGDLSAVIELEPNWSAALVHRGFQRIVIEEPDAALEDFETAIRVAPTDAEGYRGRAGVLAQRGDLADALTDLNKAIDLDPDNAACRLARTHLLLLEDDPNAAKADLDFALQLIPEFVPALFRRAHLLLSLGEHEAARRDFDTILRNDPDAVSAILGRSVAWEQAGDEEQSEKDLDEAAKAEPLNQEQLELSRLLLIASTAHTNEQFDKAVRVATQAIELTPDDVNGYRIRAAAYWYGEQFVEAVEDYSHLMACADEPDGEHFNGRGQAYAEMGEFEQALEDLKQAVELARQGSSAARVAYSLNGRGRALTGLGRFDEAERDFAESIRLKPGNAWLYFNRGLLHIAKGDPASAAACFEQSLQESNPRLTPRKRARARGCLDVPD